MLEGRKFTILYDNQDVIKSVTKQNSSNYSARVMLRHLQFISQFSTDFEYVRSEENFVADALTRSGIVFSDFPDALDFEAIVHNQKDDPEIQSFITKISSLLLK